MRKRPPSRIGQFASRGLPSILIIGTRCEDALVRRLKKDLRGARWFADVGAVSNERADLAIGLFEAGDNRTLTAFAKWAQVAGVAALCVELGQYEAIIGPLALPGRPGCGRCAFERMNAASDVEPYGIRIPPSSEAASVAGRMLTREVRAIIRQGPSFSQLVDHVLAVDSRTPDAALHQVIPLSRCSVCGGAEAFPRIAQEPLRFSGDDSPEVILGALTGWVDRRTGVISRVILEPPTNKLEGLPLIATAVPPRIMNEDGSLRHLPSGWGKGLTVSGALLSAVGEAIERYAASLPDPGRIIWERPANLDGEFVDPRELVLYTDAQYDRDGFPYARFDPSLRHPWVSGKWLGSDIPVWVPAVFAFLSLALRPEQLICQGTSNGLAASTDAEEAALRATLELVERDAFMSAWLTASPGLRVELDDTLDPLVRRVFDGMKALGATVEVYVLPRGFCGTTVLCLGLGDGDEYPGATLGLSTSFDSHSALRQAALELGQTGPYLRRMMRSNALPVPPDPSSVTDMLQHAAYYFPVDRARAFDHLRNSNARLALCDLGDSSPKPSLENCASQLETAGVRVALVDVTSADVATGPFNVVRAVSPDLQPIWYGYGLERHLLRRMQNLKLSDETPAIHPIW
jgi:ribosomal protein S12 methylthiotransferase accessory factor